MNVRKRMVSILVTAVVGIAGLGTAPVDQADAATYIYPFSSGDASGCVDEGAAYTSLMIGANIKCTFPPVSSLYPLAPPYTVWRHTYGSGHLYNGATEALKVDKIWGEADCRLGMCLQEPARFFNRVGSGDPNSLPTVQVPKGRYYCFSLTIELWFWTGSQWRIFTKVDHFDSMGNLVYEGSWSQPR